MRKNHERILLSSALTLLLALALCSTAGAQITRVSQNVLASGYTSLMQNFTPVTGGILETDMRLSVYPANVQFIVEGSTGTGAVYNITFTAANSFSVSYPTFASGGQNLPGPVPCSAQIGTGQPLLYSQVGSFSNISIGSYSWQVFNCALVPGDTLRAEITFTTAGTTKIYLWAATNTGMSAFPTQGMNPTGSGTTDPCLSPNVAKQSGYSQITTATTTLLITGQTGKSIYLCSLSVNMVATVAADTVYFEQGTGATCGTGTSTSTATYSSGIMANGSLTFSFPGSGEVLAPMSSGTSFCAVTTVGTGPSIGLTYTYIIQ
jgi:hypothetical protein